MRIKKYIYVCLMTVLAGFLLSDNTVYASDGEYITISIEADDDSGSMQYALDTDEPSAFTTNNTFQVLSGTNHTIYVKDAAGNITSQEFVPTAPDTETAYATSHNEYVEEDEGHTVNIDVVLDEYKENSNHNTEPAEPGQGTVYDRTITDANDVDAEKIFYTVTAESGEVFYLVIDQEQSANNVYLMNQVNVSELEALAIDDTAGDSEEDSEESESLLSALSGDSNEAENQDLLTSEVNTEKPKTSNYSNLIMLLIIFAIGGGVYYYMKVYRNKRDEQMDLIDAMDRDDFVAENDDEDDDDEADFGLDDDYQEQTLAMLMKEEGEEEEEDVNSSQENTYDDEELEQEKEQVPETDDAFRQETLTSYATSHNEAEMSENDNDEDFDDDLDMPDEEDDE